MGWTLPSTGMWRGDLFAISCFTDHYIFYFLDLVFPPSNDDTVQLPGSRFATMASHSTDNERIDPDVLVQAENFFEDEEQEEFAAQKRSKRPNSAGTRQKWSEAEEAEICTLFKKFFDNKTRPKPKDIVRIMGHSSSGVLASRSKDTLKKKVFRMIDLCST